MADNNGNGSITENTNIKLPLYKIIILVATVISVTASAVVFGVNIRTDIDSKAERRDFENYKTGDSINTKTLFEKVQKIDDKLNKLLRKNKIEYEE